MQLNNYIQSKFWIYLTGFPKNHGTQHALLKMRLGKKIYMDLFQAFESLNHEILIDKLRCYGLDRNAVEIATNAVK